MAAARTLLLPSPPPSSRLLLLQLVAAAAAVLAGPVVRGELRVGFYEQSCPDAEAIVRRAIAAAVHGDPTLAAPLLRLHFHDCFVRGCDGSVLLNSTSTNAAEKDAGPNRTLEAFDVVDAIKAKLEARCPGAVSCADILAVAARDAVSLAARRGSGGGKLYEVETGRRDGRASSAREAAAQLPDSFDGVRKLIRRFASKGLGLKDLAVLSGAHTLGKSHCPSMAKRLRNFTADHETDPSLDPGYAAALRRRCKGPPEADRATELEMVPGRSTSFADPTYYYRLVTERKGMFHSDEALLRHPVTRELVYGYAAAGSSPASGKKKRKIKRRFLRDFGASMVNMGRVGVLTGGQGEVRRRCALVN